MTYTKQKIEKIGIPNLKDIESMKIDALSDKIKSSIDEGNLQPYMAILDNIMSDDHSSIEIAAALLKLELGNLNSAENKKDPIRGVYIDEKRYNRPKTVDPAAKTEEEVILQIQVLENLLQVSQKDQETISLKRALQEKKITKIKV